MADTALAGDDEQPAWLQDCGPIPAGLAYTLTGDAVADAAAKATLRRPYRHPNRRAVGGDGIHGPDLPQKGLARFLEPRDQTCRTPYCNAAIRHHCLVAVDGTSDAASVVTVGSSSGV